MTIDTNERGIANENLQGGDSNRNEANAAPPTTSPTGSTLSSTELKQFTIQPGQTKPVEITVENTKITGNLIITKKDTNNDLVSGATFEVKNSKDEVVGRQITNDQGQITVSNLPYGNYTLVETKSPDKYILNSAPVSFSITKNGETVTENLVNAIITGSIKITNTDKQTGKPIEGVEFNINTPTQVQLERLTTNAQGQASSSNLPYGNYTLVEVFAPEGYDVNTNPIPFSIKTNGQVINEAITNNETKGTIVIKKLDATMGTVIAGATFNITNSNNISVTTATTGANGEVTINLLSGTYTATEIKSPIGYVLNNTPQKFTIPFNQEAPITLTFEDAEQLCKVVITKVDASDNTELLPGARFDIIDSEGGTVDTVTTGADGTASTELPAGTYTIKEVTAPEGYIPY